MAEAVTAEKADWTEGALSEPTLIEALRDYMQRTGKTQAQIARAIRRSAPTISQYLSGSFQGDRAALEAEIARLLGREAIRAEAVPSLPFVMTAQAAEALSVLSYAHVYKCIGLVYGPSGLGKTEAIRYYCADHRDAIWCTAET